MGVNQLVNRCSWNSTLTPYEGSASDEWLYLEHHEQHLIVEDCHHS